MIRRHLATGDVSHYTTRPNEWRAFGLCTLANICRLDHAPFPRVWAARGAVGPTRPGRSRMNSGPQTDAPRGRRRVLVAGVGAGGGNAINRMRAATPLGVELVTINTDVRAL